MLSVTEKMHVLIGEDDEVLQQVYIKKFTMAGYSIQVAGTGEDLLDALDDKAPNILILDVTLPVLDGFSVLKKLPKKRPFPVVILTSTRDSKKKKKGKELGVDDYLIKGEVTIGNLLEIVNKLTK